MHWLPFRSELVADQKLYQGQLLAVPPRSGALRAVPDRARLAQGYPNLNDDDWLWGGDIAAIHYVDHGIRDRIVRKLGSAMPAFDGSDLPKSRGGRPCPVAVG
jgi:hypothetical protein